MGGALSLPSPRAVNVQELENGEDSKTSLLQELQKEIDRLRLLSPGGQLKTCSEPRSLKMSQPITFFE